jgi:hypothetical protein
MGSAAEVPADLDTEFWRAAAYHNIPNSDKANSQAKEKAKQAVGTFLAKAGDNPRFAMGDVVPSRIHDG